MDSLPEYTGHKNKGPVNIPYIEKVEPGSKWDYFAHATLARTMIVRKQEPVSFEEDALIHNESVRQCSLLATRRHGWLVSGDTHKIIDQLHQEGQDTDPKIKNKVATALERADRAVVHYFKETLDRSGPQGELISEIVAARQAQRIARVRQKCSRQ